MACCPTAPPFCRLRSTRAAAAGGDPLCYQPTHLQRSGQLRRSLVDRCCCRGYCGMADGHAVALGLRALAPAAGARPARHARLSSAAAGTPFAGWRRLCTSARVGAGLRGPRPLAVVHQCACCACSYHRQVTQFLPLAHSLPPCPVLPCPARRRPAPFAARGQPHLCLLLCPAGLVYAVAIWQQVEH